MSKRAASRAKGRLRALLAIRNRDAVKCLITLKQKIGWAWPEVYAAVLEETGASINSIDMWSENEAHDIMAACARLNSVFDAAEAITECEAYPINHPGNN